MPGGDRTGPRGCGPLTGRGLGPCGRGGGFRGGYGRRGAGYGRGYGWRCWQDIPPEAPAPTTKEEEVNILKAELNELDADKREIEKRLKELEK